MLNKLVEKFNVYSASAERLREYIEWYESLDDKFEVYHPLCGVVDLCLKFNHKNCWKAMLARKATIFEWSTNYYNRIYEHLDDLTFAEIKLLCSLPYTDEPEIPVSKVVPLFRKIGYSVGDINTTHLLDIEDKYYIAIKPLFPALGEQYEK